MEDRIFLPESYGKYFMVCINICYQKTFIWIKHGSVQLNITPNKEKVIIGTSDIIAKSKENQEIVFVIVQI